MRKMTDGPLIVAASFLVGICILPAGSSAQDVAPFEVGMLFFQLNDTDGDLGIHMLVDGDPWKTVSVRDTGGRRLLKINSQSALRQQGLTELKFESAEPTFDELDPADFFGRFPEGTYTLRARGFEGEVFMSQVQISHVLPAPPENLMVSGMATPEGCDDEPIPAVGGPVVLSWDAVTGSHPDLGIAGPIEVTRYEIAVEVEEPETPVKLKLEVTLPPETSSFEVPAGFIDQGELFKFQVLVTDAGGNETSSESCFEVL